MYKTSYIAIFALVCLFIFQGCTKKPIEQLAKAESAVKEAIDADAPLSVPDEFNKADSKLTECKQLINKKKYKKAIPALEECVALANKATAMANALKKEQIKKENIIQEKVIQEHTVKYRDCLWFIAKKYYNNPYKWSMIYDANKNKIKNPDLIFPDQVFVIP